MFTDLLVVKCSSIDEILTDKDVAFINITIDIFIAVSYFNIGDVSKGGSPTIFKPVVLTALTCALV